MLVSTVIDRIKRGTHDAVDEYSEKTCIEYINNAIQQVGSLLAGVNYPPLAQSVELEDGDTLPHNFMRACGQYPMRITNNKVEFIDDDIFTIRFRYFATPELVKTVNDRLPFEHDAINEVVVSAAIILALNNNEFDISQDNNLMNALQQAIAGGMGVA